MGTIHVRVKIADDELLDLSEDIGRLLNDSADDLTPASRQLLFSIDESLVEALAPLLETDVARRPVDADDHRPHLDL